MLGYLLTTFNDSDQAVKAFDSLKASIPVGVPYKVTVVDAGSTEEHITRIQSNIGECIGPEPDLSSALNTGIYKLLGYAPDNIKQFIKTGASDVTHVIWYHVDMACPDFNWGEKLAFCYDFCYPMIGRMGPATNNIDNGHPNQGALYGANQCPVIFGIDVLKKLLEKYGFIYDPRYRAIGGREDWDNGRRLAELGMGFARCNLVDVWHKGMGSRSLRDTSDDQRYNADVYYKNWGTWDQPGFEIDMTEIGNDLKKAFEAKFPERWYDK